ncbi:zf-TFIIB domain-containing protein, partial [Candidatus Woesearchaeota archaeon]|nr:zf-TFIIB domain-containing protein [Candidatus Woesearchaeota archaeon]
HKKMKQATREDVTIDYCKKCGGLWLDKGEMEKIIEIQHRAMEKFSKQEKKQKERLKKQKTKSKKK